MEEFDVGSYEEPGYNIDAFIAAAKAYGGIDLLDLCYTETPEETEDSDEEYDEELITLFKMANRLKLFAFFFLYEGLKPGQFGIPEDLPYFIVGQIYGSNDTYAVFMKDERLVETINWE